MSIENADARGSSGQLSKLKVRTKTAADRRPNAAEDTEDSDLALDDDYGVDSDPYNCTGQHLLSQIRESARDQ